jgi:hypothetical protein
LSVTLPVPTPVRSHWITEEQPAAPKKLGERCGTNRPKPFRRSLVRECTELLRHREASLTQTALWRLDLQMQGVQEIGAGRRHHQRQPERRLVELIDRNDDQRTRLRLL